jgi:hypothetical protein
MYVTLSVCCLRNMTSTLTGSPLCFLEALNFYGSSGVQFYTKLKTVTSHWPTETVSLGGAAMPTFGSTGGGGGK